METCVRHAKRMMFLIENPYTSTHTSSMQNECFKTNGVLSHELDWVYCTQNTVSKHSLIVFPKKDPDILMMMIITIKSRCPEV